MLSLKRLKYHLESNRRDEHTQDSVNTEVLETKLQLNYALENLQFHTHLAIKRADSTENLLLDA